MRNPLKRRPSTEPKVSLRERLRATKAKAGRVLAVIRRERNEDADPSRRFMVAGSLAAAVPLPAVALTAPAVRTGPHPDAALLAAGARYERAIVAEQAASDACDAAWEYMKPVLSACPAEAVVSRSDRLSILGGACWPTRVGGQLRWLPSRDGTMCEGWTGEVLRNAIRQAVPRLGRGGQTPHHVRRWKGMLPIVDAFDADVRRAEAACGHCAKAGARRVARSELIAAMSAVQSFTPATVEGLAFTLRVGAAWQRQGCTLSPKLLQATASAIGLDLSSVAQPRPGFLD